jgi:hypothetical protein
MGAIYSAISAVMGEMAKEGIAKDSKNKQQGWAFRGIDAVYNALAPKLAHHGIIIFTRCLSRTVTERQTKNGGNLFYVVVDCEFDFVSAEDGSKHTVRTFGEAMDSGDKATNKAMSIALKYAAFQTFFIPTEVTTNDPDSTTHNVLPSVSPVDPAIDEAIKTNNAPWVKAQYNPGVIKDNWNKLSLVQIDKINILYNQQ